MSDVLIDVLTAVAALRWAQQAERFACVNPQVGMVPRRELTAVVRERFGHVGTPARSRVKSV
jgi:hypothetical protein